MPDPYEEDKRAAARYEKVQKKKCHGGPVKVGKSHKDMFSR
jgi:hypothetical protein